MKVPFNYNRMLHLSKQNTLIQVLPWLLDIDPWGASVYSTATDDVHRNHWAAKWKGPEFATMA